jgi:hypothetical protein
VRIPAVLNDLSLQGTSPSRPEARVAVESVVHLSAETSAWGCMPAVVVDRDLWELELCPNDYTVVDWSLDEEVPRQVREVFLGLVTAVPFRDQWPPDRVAAYDAVFPDLNGIQVLALGAAAVGNALAISAPTLPEWNRPTLEITLTTADQSASATVRHAARETHLSTHSNWRIEQLIDCTQTAQELINDADFWFPNLEFCREASTDLSEFTVNGAEFRVFIERLFELNSCARNWTEGGFVKESLGGNPRRDGPATLGQFGGQRTRTREDGTSHTFAWHLNGMSGTRLYFEPIGPGRIVVGPITRHLSTKKFQ